jgi:hypothetical protein
VRADERGQASVLIIGFAGVLAMVIALVVDATAAYLQHSGLDGLADGAALHGADLGATGEEVYGGGLPQGGELILSQAQARAAVAAYLERVGARQDYPGLRYAVSVDPVAKRVDVRLEAPMSLPLDLPGGPDRTRIGAHGSAIVFTDDRN